VIWRLGPVGRNVSPGKALGRLWTDGIKCPPTPATVRSPVSVSELALVSDDYTGAYPYDKVAGALPLGTARRVHWGSLTAMIGMYHHGTTRLSPAALLLFLCSAMSTAAVQGQRTLHAQQTTLSRLQWAGRCTVSGVADSVMFLKPQLRIQRMLRHADVDQLHSVCSLTPASTLRT